MIKLYVFLDDDGKIIEQVRAENHDEALRLSRNPSVDFDTDFYATEAA